ncbi:MAG: hypothetical protein E7481_03290 [Ruminococcaceae bacterium]|nr:hypothetical protein [Oscillospiraceae bacterium]
MKKLTTIIVIAILLSIPLTSFAHVEQNTYNCTACDSAPFAPESYNYYTYNTFDSVMQSLNSETPSTDEPYYEYCWIIGNKFYEYTGGNSKLEALSSAVFSQWNLAAQSAFGIEFGTLFDGKSRASATPTTCNLWWILDSTISNRGQADMYTDSYTNYVWNTYIDENDKEHLYVDTDWDCVCIRLKASLISDTSSSLSDIVKKTATHEFGHAWGLGHHMGIDSGESYRYTNSELNQYSSESIMFFDTQWNYFGRCEGPQPRDIASIYHLVHHVSGWRS